jgi:glycosyltransferase involved in cell wall biosynthesis
MKKKICFVVSSPLTAKAFLINHIQELSSIFDVYLVANFENGLETLFKEVPIKGWKNIVIPRDINLIDDFKALLQLRTYFSKMKFDAVHSVTPKAGLLGSTASRLAGIKVRIHIFTGQVWHTRTGMFKKLLMFLDRVIVTNATHILVDGESQRQFLIQQNIIEAKNSKVLGKGSISGVNSTKFMPDSVVKHEVRAELGIRDEEIVFMFLGRMNIDKGIPELAIAFNEITKKHSNVLLLFVGGDEQNMTPLVKTTIQAIDKVIFYGSTPYPERLLQACDIFCLPSHREGFGTSVIEASLLEKPVICSDTYGLMETILDNTTGIRHKVNNAASLQTAMETMLNDTFLRVEYGKNGRNYVLENFTAQKITDFWISFYKETLDV